MDRTIVHADVRTLIRNNPADGRVVPAADHAPLLHRLAAAGCDRAAIISPGGPFRFAKTAGLSPLPLASGVVRLDAFFAVRGFGRVGRPGTRVVMRTRLQGQLRRTEAAVLAGPDLNLVFDGQEPGYGVIDVRDVHLDQLADLGTGRRGLSEGRSPPGPERSPDAQLIIRIFALMIDSWAVREHMSWPSFALQPLPGQAPRGPERCPILPMSPPARAAFRP